MDLSNTLSIIALVIAVGSFAVTIWATQISKRSLQYAIEVQVGSDKKEFERTRADLMNRIADSRSVLDKTRIEIGALEANFHAEPPAIRSMMQNYLSLFTEYLPNIERAIQQCDQLWNDV